MSNKVEEPVQEPQIEEPEDDEGEESDEYDNIEEEEDEEAGGYAQDEEGEGDEANVTAEGSSLTALLLGGEEAAEEEDEDEDDEFEPTSQNGTIQPPSIPASALAPGPGISAPPLGKKRSRQDTEAEDVEGDYGEVEENSETVLKKARAAADEPEAEVEVEEV